MSLPRGKKGMIPPGKAPSLCSPPLCAGLPGLLGLFLRGLVTVAFPCPVLRCHLR